MTIYQEILARRALCLPLVDLTDDEAPAVEIAFKTCPIAARLASWADGWKNARQVGDVHYSWDANPRAQQNGSVIGRVYAHARGESPRDIGAFKIDRDGNVLAIPAQLRGVLPGTAS